MTRETISHYSILSKLGSGGMGEVYKARDLTLDRLVALKILPTDLVEDKDRVRRFVQEAKSASALNHPNIVTIYEIGQAQADDGPGGGPVESGVTHYIAMELVDGETLRRKIHHRDTGLRPLLEWLAQAGEGLSKAHQSGIVHRDLKPDNIMVTEDGYAKILDFGLAKLVEPKKEISTEDTAAPTAMMQHTQAGVVMGTIGYMSPEQAQGKAVDYRSDIFSFGCILYEVATKRKPFEGESVIDTLHKIIYAPARPFEEMDLDCPAELQRIIFKCLAKDREARYQSMKEVAADLKGLVRDLELGDGDGRRPRSTAPDLSGRVTVMASDPHATAAASSPPGPATSGVGRITEKIKRRKLASVVALCALLMVGAAVWFAINKLSAPSFEIPVEQFTLKNGLRVILSEDHSTPTYSICVTYNVGSRDERPGRTGFAHLFEHMMFQGSENVGKGEHFILIANNGGNMNGSAAHDHTQYFQTLPANQLELGLFLESDRMRSLAINQANLDNQRQVVLEERRMQIENKAYGRISLELFDTAYDNFAYKHPVIGSMEDLNAATVDEMAEFFKTYYAPNNAVVTLVGDFNREEARAKIERYFEEIPSQPIPPTPDFSEPEQQGERRKTIEDRFAQAPFVALAYKVPAGNTPDWYAMRLLSQVLVGGESSRLHQKLVKEKEAASHVSGQPYELRGPSLFLLGAVARPGKDLAQVEKLVYEEMERVKNEPVEDWEIEKARIRLRHVQAYQLQTTQQRSILLGQYAVNYGEPDLINTYWEKINRITKDDIQRVARTYLNETNRTVILTVAKPDPVLSLQAASASTEQGAKAVPVTKVERKNRAPVSSEILKLKLPRVVEATLDNGLTLLILEDHRIPTVSLTFHINGAGLLHEPKNLPDLAQVTAQMLRGGTALYTSKQIAEGLERQGATLFTETPTGYSAAAVSATGLSDNFDEWFALVSDIIINPTFPADELNTYKQRRNVELKYQRGDAGFLAEEQFRRAVFGDHPAGARAATAESINLITPEMLARWHKERYAPQNTILGIAGDINADELISKVKDRLAGWQRTSLSEGPIPNPEQPSARKVYLVDRPGSVQTTIIMGNLAIDRRNPDYNSILVANHVLGADFAARLAIKLREEKGYAYQAFSYFYALNYQGSWRARSDMRTEVTEAAITALLEELRRMSEERVSEEELEERKRSVASSFALSLESPFQLLEYAITRKVYSFSADYWSTYPAKVMGVGGDDVQRVAGKYLNPETIQVVAVGDAKRIMPMLEKYGPVEVYDTQGRQVSAKAASALGPKAATD